MDFSQGDALTSHNFGLQIDGVFVAYLSQVSGIKLTQDVITLQQNTADGRPEVAVLPGVVKNGECTVKRGATESDEFTKWQNDSINGRMSEARKNASIILLNTEREEQKRWNMRNAWCAEVEISELKAGDASTLTETVKIVFEEMYVD